jgi:hypothetical protein
MPHTLPQAALALILGIALAPTSATAVTPIALNGALYQQNFSTLPMSGNTHAESAIPTGWTFSEAGSSANNTFSADSGTNTVGNAYSYGPAGSADRAFGEFSSSILTATIGASFINTTGFVITQLSVSYIGEQWRLGAGDANVDRLDFQVSLNATSLTTGSWTNVDALDFAAPNNQGAAGPTNGNVLPNRTIFPSVVINTTPIPNLGSIWIRWTSTDVLGNDDGLAVDDVVLRTTPLSDFDLDSDVDGNDFLRWQRGVGTFVTGGHDAGDADFDGNIASDDLAIWRAQFGPDATPAVVAEPTDVALLDLATAAVVLNPPPLQGGSLMLLWGGISDPSIAQSVAFTHRPRIVLERFTPNQRDKFSTIPETLRASRSIETAAIDDAFSDLVLGMRPRVKLAFSQFGSRSRDT